jgi:hypothetical protein
MVEQDRIVAAILASGFCNKNLHQPTHDDFIKHYQEFLLLLKSASTAPPTPAIISHYENLAKKQE